MFEAWTNPDHLVHWWGPDGFTNTMLEFDFRVGGIWRFIMHGPDGTDYDNKITYLEIEPPARLLYDHGDESGPPQFRAEITFEADGARTHVTMRSVFPTAQARDDVVREVGAIEGGNQTLGRLAEYLRGM